MLLQVRLRRSARAGTCERERLPFGGVPGYQLAVDLGTTWTAAAVARDGRVEVVQLGQRTAAIPTVLVVEADGTVVVGEAAARRALDAPERFVREVKRRVGDDTPVLVGGAPWPAELLLARVLRHVVDQVATEQGAWPDAVWLTHPANWGRYKLDLFEQAARQVGVEPAGLVPEPVAAAAWYAASHRVADGAVVAVYDLGGGTFDAAVVRRNGDRYELLGRPDGVERLGGIDVDAAVFDTVTQQLGDAWTSLDPGDPATLADVAELRARCVDAKEALSTDTVATVPVRLPAARTSVRVTRAELESMVRGPIGETVVALQRTIASAGLAPIDLAAVLLVGGASRMPIVAQEVGAALGVPVAVDANPKLTVAQGAAHLAGTTSPTPAPTPAPVATPPPIVEAHVRPHDTPEPGRRRRWVPLAAGAGALALLAAAVVVLGGGDGDGDGDGGDDDEVEAAGDATGDGDDTDALVIGLLAPDSGSLDFLGPSFRVAGDLALADVNEAGGVLGEDIELVVADSGDAGGDPEVDAVQELLDAGADVVVGPAGRVTTEAVIDAVADSGAVGCAATGSDLPDGADERWISVIGTRAHIEGGLDELSSGVDGFVRTSADDPDGSSPRSSSRRPTASSRRSSSTTPPRIPPSLPPSSTRAATRRS